MLTEGVLPIALLRTPPPEAAASGAAAFPYVYTCPAPHSTLRAGDRVYVLVSPPTPAAPAPGEAGAGATGGERPAPPVHRKRRLSAAAAFQLSSRATSFSSIKSLGRTASTAGGLGTRPGTCPGGGGGGAGAPGGHHHRSSSASLHHSHSPGGASSTLPPDGRSCSRQGTFVPVGLHRHQGAQPTVGPPPPPPRSSTLANLYDDVVATDEERALAGVGGVRDSWANPASGGAGGDGGGGAGGPGGAGGSGGAGGAGAACGADGAGGDGGGGGGLGLTIEVSPMRAPPTPPPRTASTAAVAPSTPEWRRDRTQGAERDAEMALCNARMEHATTATMRQLARKGSSGTGFDPLAEASERTGERPEVSAACGYSAVGPSKFQRQRTARRSEMPDQDSY